MSDPQSVESKIAIVQLGKEVQYLRDELRETKDAAQSLKEYSLGNFARFEIKMEILIKTCTFLAATTAGAIILTVVEVLKKR